MEQNIYVNENNAVSIMYLYGIKVKQIIEGHLMLLVSTEIIVRFSCLRIRKIINSS